MWRRGRRREMNIKVEERGEEKEEKWTVNLQPVST
jgi:hypothetical protein